NGLEARLDRRLVLDVVELLQVRVVELGREGERKLVRPQLEDPALLEDRGAEQALLADGGHDARPRALGLVGRRRRADERRGRGGRGGRRGRDGLLRVGDGFRLRRRRRGADGGRRGGGRRGRDGDR